jgi:cobalamin biosynthesis Mg chelatase CobN
VGVQAYTISGSIYPTPTLPDSVNITVQLLGSSAVMDSSIQTVTASGTFSYTTHVGEPYSWTSGPYLVTAIDSYGLKTTMKFEYSASVTTTSTTTTTSTGPPIATQTSTQTVTTTIPTTVTQTMTTTQSPTAATVTQTVTGPASTVINTQTTTNTVTQTVTGPASTVTNTATSTVTQTTSAIPGWAYGVMVVLLLVGLAIGYVVKRPSIKQS